MPVVLLLLIEKMVLSPVVQRSAWDAIKPYLENGHAPPQWVLDRADRMADEAHKAAQG